PKNPPAASVPAPEKNRGVNSRNSTKPPPVSANVAMAPSVGTKNLNDGPKGTKKAKRAAARAMPKHRRRATTRAAFEKDGRIADSDRLGSGQPLQARGRVGGGIAFHPACPLRDGAEEKRTQSARFFSGPASSSGSPDLEKCSAVGDS